MKLNRVMIAAPKSGSGKTTITCALLQALKNRGLKVAAYKCGPDYIDPMFHKRVIGIPSKNLDTFFTDADTTGKLFLLDRTEEEFAVLEGVMGLFDGLGGIREEGSSYHLAKVTKTPIVLVVDAKGMGRSVISLIAGFLAYDTEHLIKGVILNRMSQGYFDLLKPLIEKELNITALGYFSENKELHIDSRHLGLTMPEELADMKAHLQRSSEQLEKSVSIEDVIKIASEAEELKTEYGKRNDGEIGGRHEDEDKAAMPVIAVARDEAFCFYYEDNLRLLKEAGAKLTFFSPIHDSKLPKGCCGLLLGGGYPELYAEQLSANENMLVSIRKAIKQGMPVVAECGGFMYLHSAITDQNGITYKMAGVIPDTCFYKGKLVRFGYIELEEKTSSFLPEGEKIRAHEFHYFDSTNNGNAVMASKPVTGKTYPCILKGENYWMGFPHLYYPSNSAFAFRFVEKAGQYQDRML